MADATVTTDRPRSSRGVLLLVAAVAAALAGGVYLAGGGPAGPPAAPPPPPKYQPRQPVDSSGFGVITQLLRPWPPAASLDAVRDAWRQAAARGLDQVAAKLDRAELPAADRAYALVTQATLLNYAGQSAHAYQVLETARAVIEADAYSATAANLLYTVVYFQGVTALRRAEDDNCILCRGESSCIFPLNPAAVHTNTTGSRLAVGHFTEYLRQFPDDVEVRWLLNLAHMTLGEHPAKVDPAHLMTFDRFAKSEFDIGRFRDVGHLVEVNRLNQAGAGVMDDFDNDGLLDLVTTSNDTAMSAAFSRNTGAGTFEDRTKAAGLSAQLGGLYCVQADYDNDGFLDVLVVRGAWAGGPVRPSLLRNDGKGAFIDVTAAAGLAAPVNSISAAWADYDNDGFVDVFVCCEQQANLLYRNRGDGTFEEVAATARVATTGPVCKGAAWLDYDNDGYPDLFLNHLGGTAALYRNNTDGTFANVTGRMGVNGPLSGFSCWAFDYDNDGWLDIFATSYDRRVEDIVRGLLGEPHDRATCKLYRNTGGTGFKDVTREAGLDGVYSTMGSNFADFDNDGFLDMYLATGDPGLSTLVPNRMFKNVAGRRFADITGSSGTGHLQKGHGVSCGDWDRNGTVDLFVETGGAVPGDRYHNVLFQNPGQGNNWLTVKLVGTKTNRGAVGARIKVVTAGPAAATVHRHVSSGSSFGGNPLEQTVGLGKADRVATLEVRWPTSGTTQVFRDVPANRMIEITELAADYKTVPVKPVPLPK